MAVTPISARRGNRPMAFRLVGSSSAWSARPSTSKRPLHKVDRRQARPVRIDQSECSTDARPSGPAFPPIARRGRVNRRLCYSGIARGGVRRQQAPPFGHDARLPAEDLDFHGDVGANARNLRQRHTRGTTRRMPNCSFMSSMASMWWRTLVRTDAGADRGSGRRHRPASPHPP